MTHYAIKELNGNTFTQLNAETLTEALKEAEKLIVDSVTKNITGVWEYRSRPIGMRAIWIPGKGGWTNIQETQ